MRILAAVFIASVLAGSTPISPAWAAPVPKAVRPGAKAAAAFPLAGSTPDEVKAWLGDPAVANEEGKGAFWTYRLDDCALMVFFKDTGSGLRVSGVGTGPRKRADTAPDAESCIASAKRQ